MLALRASVFMLFQTLSLVFWALLFTAIGPLLPFRKRYWFGMRWSAMNIWAAKKVLGIRYQVIGAQNLPRSPVVFLSKHESAWETMFYPYYFPHELCFVLKRELLWLPFFGWSVAMLRMIAIDRGDGGTAFSQVLEKGTHALRHEKRPVVFFPEGTRVSPGRQLKFKTGGARLAIAAGVPVVPIAMNSGDVWPRKSFIKRPGLITVSIGKALLPDGEDATTLTAKAETWIQEEMRRISPHRLLKGPE
jgi:1-acyl-sn-glycerol-3-phosphate acyltransferase